MTRVLLVLTTTTGLTGLAACRGHMSSTGESARTTSSESIPSDASVQVTEEIAAHCKLVETPSSAPHFDFDSAQLEDRAARIVSDVASCLTRGPLLDAEITLTGHTDARGSPHYNEQLGLYRAEAVRLALIDLGVPPERIHVASRGEKDATGADASKRPFDRRVEISLKRGVDRR